MRFRRPSDPRALALVDQLDRAYFHFSSGLPGPLRTLAESRRVFSGQPLEEPFEGPSGMNPILTGLPWLFWERFSAVDDELLLQLALPGALLAMASSLMDHLVDGQSGPPGQIALLHQGLLQRAEAGFRRLFPSGSNFWKSHDRLAAEHLAGLASEAAVQSEPAALTLQAFLIQTGGKAAPMLYTAAALAEAAGEPELLDPIERSIKLAVAAGQLDDDVGDWEGDLNDGHLTYFLVQLAPEADWRRAQLPPEDRLRSTNEEAWLDLDYWSMAIAWLEQAEASAETLACPEWNAYLQDYRQEVRGRQERAAARHLQRALAPLSGSVPSNA